LLPSSRDIDYAAVAVKSAIVDKFGRTSSLEDLEVTAGERLITVRQDAQLAEGTRDDLMSAVRRASTYQELWELLPIKRG
jgi:hypothetical protein